MSEESPKSLAQRFFHACLYVLGGVIAVSVTLSLLARIWGWLLLSGLIVAVLCLAVLVVRYWWGRRF